MIHRMRLLRRPFRMPRLCGLAALCCLALAGCEEVQLSNFEGLPAAAADTQPVAFQSPPLLPEWKNPRAVLVFSGDEHGYMEPCGCTGGQLGGFAKRAEMFRQLREVNHWPTLAFSLGGMLNERRAAYLQSRIKFTAMRRGLNDMGYKGLVWGQEELQLQPDELYNQHVATVHQNGFDVPFMSANITLFGTKEADIPPIDFRILEAGGLKIAVVAVTGPSAVKELQFDAGLLTFVPPETVLPAVLAKVKAQSPQVLVLLSHSTLEEAKALIAKFPEFQIAAISDPLALGTSMIGNTLLVPIGGEKGNQVAVAGIFQGPDRRLTFQGRQLEMRDTQFPDHPSMTKVMRDYQNELQARFADLMASPIADPTQGSFVGVDNCKGCHQAAYDVWAASGHATHSYDGLIEGRHDYVGEWVPRIYDPECLSCHATGWQPQTALRYKSGFIDVQSTPHLNNQQCENCHGPGSKHVELERSWTAGTPVSPELQAARESVRLTRERAKQETCARCHDGDNSPKFDFDTWWPNIEH